MASDIIRINEQLSIISGGSPSGYDLIITSISASHTPGYLNQFALREFDYLNSSINAEQILSKLDLRKGYDILKRDDLKPIIFIVTVDHGLETNKLLEINLKNALNEYRSILLQRSIWIPLMGTGAGGLSNQLSFEIIYQVINSADIFSDSKFFLSLPKEKYGEDLFNELRKRYTVKINNQRNYYVGGSSWDGVDRSNEFFKTDAWENGRDDKFSGLVNSVKPGDIIFMKSTFQRDSKSILRIKGVGLVLGNPMNGVDLHINWYQRGLLVDIDGLGYLRNTIHKLSYDEANIVLRAIDSRKDLLDDATLLSKNVANESDVYRNRSTIADLICDSDQGADYLDISKDVRAFSKIMAARSFKPPLAIALFGEWGAGKSFFMNKLRGEIDRLSLRSSSTYCSGIAQIHFNAWSYLDANLWASLVSKTFDGLNDFITENTASDEIKREVEKDLSERLTITREEIASLDKHKESLTLKIEELKSEKKLSEEKLKEQIEEIDKNTLSSILTTTLEKFDPKTKIEKAIDSNPSIHIAKEQIKELVPEKYWDNPDKVYEEATSSFLFLRKFFDGKEIGWNVFWICFAVLIVFTVPLYLTKVISVLRDINFVIPQAFVSFLIAGIPLWQRAKATVNQLQPFVVAMWSVKKEYDKEIESAKSNFDQHEKVLKIKIEQNEIEIENINHSIQQTQQVLAEVEFKMESALSTEALHTFIEKRSSSEDYKKHLGIISTIRKDFEILSSLFDEANEEAQKFRDKFNKPLERIILYIDDLDRCPEDRVVEVLEAVNLLMAFPLFIVVVGVDARWVKNALLKKYDHQFGFKLKKESSYNLYPIDVSNYLEKIFQIPFHLKEATDSSVKSMLKTLAAPRIHKYEVEDDLPDFDLSLNDLSRSKINIIQQSEISELKQSEAQGKASSEPEYLSLTDIEIETIQQFSTIIGSNPRSIKRFVNVYQIIRSHEDFTFNLNTENLERQILMFLLAVPVGPFNILMGRFKVYMTSLNFRASTLAEFLSDMASLNEFQESSLELTNIVQANSEFQLLAQAPVYSFSKHHKFIQRFTFDDNI